MMYALLTFSIHVLLFLFKSSVLFGAHTSLDKSLKVLKLATDLSNLTTNG